jgi:dienelactone hydrolase
VAEKNFIKKIISSQLIQTFLIYVSGGWITLEMTDYFINKYGLNERFSDILSIILLIGLPVVIFLAWYMGKEKEEDEKTFKEEPGQRLLGNQNGKIRRILYSARKTQILIPGILILMAIAITVVFRFRHQSKIEWAREVVLPQIEEITASNMTWQGQQSWTAFDLANEANKYIPDDPLLARLEQLISWNVNFKSNPSKALVYIKSYEDPDAEWRLLGETPIDSVRLPRGLSIIKIEKDNFLSTHDLIWYHWTFIGNSLYYDLTESGSIPEEMVMIYDTMISLTSWPMLRLPGLEEIEYENTGDFLMDRYEVTNEEYKRFVDAGGYQNPDYWKCPILKEGHMISMEDAMALFIDKTGRKGPATWQIGDYPDGQDDFPVTGVSWYEAAAYAEFVGKSLPTIFHWNETSFAYASGIIIPNSNFNQAGPMAVGSTKSMNRFGIYDLAGNVREWCFNTTAGESQRYIMGGGWTDPSYSFIDTYAQNPLDRSEINGFRCVKYLGSEENLVGLKKTIPRPTRDFLNEQKVSDEIFTMFRRQYEYDKTDLNALVEEIAESEDYTREKITFDAAYGGDRMMAYLFLPKNGTPPFQTVIYFPGGNVIHQRSSEQISGIDMFVKSGRALLFPIYKGTFERGDDLKSDHPNETTFYKEHVIMWVKDLSRSIDYLETRNDIDTEKLAYYGFSWGGFIGSIIPAVEQRIKTSILVVAGLPFERSLPEVEPIHYLPRITTPVLMLNGKYDFFFPYETSQLPFYELLGTPEEHKQIILYEQGHAVPETQLTKETLTWLDRYLGPVE